jgi:Zn-dependent metalloprotease
MTHYRCQQKIAGNPIHNGIFIIHSKNDIIHSVNGSILSNSDFKIQNNQNIDKNTALNYALNYVDADVYKWELEGEEKTLKYVLNDDKASFYPEGKLILIPDFTNPSLYYLCWEFKIYAHSPMSHQRIFVDAANGEIRNIINCIHNTDVPGTGNTAYNGNQSIVADSYGGSYRLRESGRGQGVETYDMNEGTDYNYAVDFTDADNNWNNNNAQLDQYATDAHFATERTYDYFYNVHGRNSIDNNGHKLVSYIHFDVKYVNAFWNGYYMTYGDGGSMTYPSTTPLTTIDICGHEITHGLTSKTCDLDYQNESGAINEGFSDIFGTMVEFFAVPSSANWTVGEDMGLTLRSLANPNAYNLPDTYFGNHWVPLSASPNQQNDYGGVHYNCGVLMYWFYLVSEGGSGTNDNGDSYSVTGIGKTKASDIAFRLQTIYLINTSDFSDARTYAIQSAVDLYGACTPEVEAVTNAMYAVGIGPAYVPNVVSDFVSDYTTFCQAPATVNFTNASINASTYIWDFGDGNTSTQANPTHTYTAYGDYTVELIADGGSCGKDTLVESFLISVQPTNPCTYLLGVTTNSTETGCTGILFDSGGNGDYQDNTNYAVTIQPAGASSVEITFNSFDFEAGYDYVYIYDGPTTSSPQITGSPFDGTTLPNNGNPITSSGGAITIRQTTDGLLTRPGFELEWDANFSTGSMTPNFFANSINTCTGIIEFKDSTSHCPYTWYWDFGDGNTSIYSNPTHTYTANGLYTVKLVVSNSSGTDSIIKTNYINVNMPPAPTASNNDRCGNGSVVLTASGNGTLQWFDQITGGNILDTGSTFTTPSLSSTTYYYVQSADYGSSSYGGETYNSANGSIFTSPSSHYLVFDVSSPILLKSVEVTASGAGNRTIELQDNLGNTLQSRNISIPDGTSRINLNFDIDPGIDYRLVGPNSPDLFRNNSNCNYPYNIANMVNITKSSAASNPTGYYYYFYDWEIAEVCKSPRDTAIATINPYPTADFSTNTISWDWDFGDGNSSNLQNPSHTYATPGTYFVSLTCTNACGTNQHLDTLHIMNAGINDIMETKVNIYPNPTKNIINISFASEENQQYTISFYNLLGEEVHSLYINGNGKQLHLTQNVQSFAKGIYYLNINSNHINTNKAIIIQ